MIAAIGKEVLVNVFVRRNEIENSKFRRVRKIAKRDYYLRPVCLSTWKKWAPTGRIVMKFDIGGKNSVVRGRPQMTTWRMRTACWIPRATNIHSKYVILIAFPRKPWLYDRDPMLFCTYIVFCFGWMRLRICHISGWTAIGTWSRCHMSVYF
jgi:hypothetical protein